MVETCWKLADFSIQFHSWKVKWVFSSDQPVKSQTPHSENILEVFTQTLREIHVEFWKKHHFWNMIVIARPHDNYLKTRGEKYRYRML